jgi:hypothetical protein
MRSICHSFFLTFLVQSSWIAPMTLREFPDFGVQYAHTLPKFNGKIVGFRLHR